MKLPAVVLVFVGVVLVYSAVKHRDPRNVVLEALGSKRRVADPYAIDGGALGKDAADGAKAGADALKGIPDPGIRPPSTSGTGPVVSV